MHLKCSVFESILMNRDRLPELISACLSNACLSWKLLQRNQKNFEVQKEKRILHHKCKNIWRKKIKNQSTRWNHVLRNHYCTSSCGFGIFCGRLFHCPHSFTGSWKFNMNSFIVVIPKRLKISKQRERVSFEASNFFLDHFKFHFVSEILTFAGLAYFQGWTWSWDINASKNVFLFVCCSVVKYDFEVKNNFSFALITEKEKFD